MPLFSYHCTGCDTEFEILVIGAEQPTSPDCGSAELEKLLSRVAPEPRVPEPVGACGSCAQYGRCAAGQG
jgi:putative FmdB family regulatory protein